MKHLFIFLVTLTALLSAEEPEELALSTPEAIASLTIAPDTLIGGIISPLSGMPILRVTDLVAKGAQEIPLTRTYLSPYMPVQLAHTKKHQGEYEKKYLQAYLVKNYKGWQYLPHFKLELFPERQQVHLSEPSGATFAFRLTAGRPTLVSHHAITNTAGETPGGVHDVRNTRITCQKEIILVQAPDGTTRHYKFARRINDRAIYFLEKEALPNGKLLKYTLVSPTVIRIESKDLQERYTYATLTIDTKEKDVHFTASSGEQATYHYTQDLLNWHIKDKTKTSKFEEKAAGLLPPRLTSVTSPLFASESLDYCGRSLLANYRGQEVQCGLHHNGFGINTPQERHYRVDKLFLPVGKQDAFIDVYAFDYQPAIAGRQEGKTTVKRLDGTSTVYHFSKKLLLTQIQSFDHETLKQDKRLTWTDNNWLQSIEMRDGEGHTLYRRAFEYDAFGNPIREHFTGDLTGHGQEETCTTLRTFSDDGSNLLLSETEENGKTTVYSYVPGTRLLKEQSNELQRTLHRYDDANNLIETLHEGPGGTRVTQYILRQEQPYLHMPEWIIESDGKKRHLTYDTAGNVIEEAIYGADGQHAYTLYKTYNARGDILTETNPLGDLATYTYDERGRRVGETNFSGRLKKETRYDMRGRLLALQENARNTDFTYDIYDRCLSKTDFFGQATHYTYDPVSAQVTQTTLAERTTRTSYDALGRKLTTHDANGHATHYRYNAYGSPTEILYPDGGKETFLYAKNGWLQSHTTLDGLTIRYERDTLGRVLKKTYGDSAEEQFTYDAFQLLSETDKEGHTKSYFYDDAGRKIREGFCGRVTHYTYDPLGELAMIETDGLVTRYMRDLAGRVCEERKTDTAGTLLYKIGYAYDRDGNRTAITRHIRGNEVTQTFSFDPFGRCTEELDAFGNRTSTLYDEEDVLRVTTTDPLSRVKIDTYDIFSQLVKTEKYDKAGNILSGQEVTYDPHGNVLCQQDHVYQEGQFQHTHRIDYTYTPTQHVQCSTRNAERATHYTYLASGKMQSKTLPDGTVLSYAYDALGFLSRIDSSDGAIHHAFARNRLGHLTSAYDENQDLLIERRVDPFGNVLLESFPSGLQVEKTYDDHNRLTSLALPYGHVYYAYDPLYLRTITRTPSTGESYTFTYPSYDLDGHLLLETLPGEMGDIVRAPNAKGQEVYTKAPYFFQQYRYDSCDNLFGIIGDNVGWQYTYDGLSQLIAENAMHTYTYDSLFNRTHKNGIASPTNTLNELEEHTYDLNGCQTTHNGFTLTHDPLQRLIAATGATKQIHFTYDPLGRRISKTVTTGDVSETEHYLYHGTHEIGAFAADHSCKNLRILNGNRTLAIEHPDQTYIALHDIQNNVRRLIDLKTRALADSYDFSAFGEEVQPTAHVDNPWRFASKRFDPDLRLIDFGARLYNPHAGRWLTPDPAGFVDSANLYQYVFNNPFKYSDPDGRFVIEISLALAWKLVVAACATAVVGYEITQMQTQRCNSSVNDFNAGFDQAVKSIPQASMGLVGDFLIRKLVNENIDVSISEKRHTPDQEAMSELVKESERQGVSNTDADTLLGWANEYDFPNRDDRGKRPMHWVGGEHIHLGPKHIKVN